MRETESGTYELVARTIELAPDEVLLREGESSEQMFLVLAGELVVERATAGGRSFAVARVTAGQIVGELSLLTGRPISATVRAVTGCSLRAISRASFDGLAARLAGQPEALVLDLARGLAGALVRTTDHNVDALLREVEESRARAMMGSFVVHVLLGFAAYAVVMKYLGVSQVPLHVAALLTGPMMVGMAAVAWSFARRSGLPRAAFGLSLADAGRHARQAALWTAPLLVALVGVKWALVRSVPELQGTAVFTMVEAPPGVEGVLGVGLYALLVPLQEFLARGAIQGPLHELLTGSRRRRVFWSVLVSNALFAITHLHLTLTYSAAAFVGGLLWGVLYARQGSLVGPVVAHVLIGVFGLFVLGFVELLTPTS